MNRSFRAPERQMQRRREKEEELALFLEMRKHEKERNDVLLLGSEELDAPSGSRPETSAAIFNIPSSAPTRRTGTDDFLNSENDKNDYDWLLTPPGTPLFPSLETESQRTIKSPTGTPKTRPTSLKSRLANPQAEPSAKTHLTSRQTALSPVLTNSTQGRSAGSAAASSKGVRRPSSSGVPGSRPSTPTGRPTLTSTSKPASTNVSKFTLTTSSKSTTITSKSMPSVSKPSRSSTPTFRPTLPSAKPTNPPRSSTPTNRPTIPVSKPTSRSSTPTRRSTILSTSTNSHAPPVKPTISASTKPAPPRSSSPIVKPRPWNPSEMPGFSLDAPPNLRTSLPNRPLSTTRGRPGAPIARSSSVEPVSSERIKRQSCSPSRGRPRNGVKNSYGGSVPAVSRIHAKANESVSPGLVGTKMVERVINMRRLIPPKNDDKQSPRSNLSGKSSSPDSSGFGRSFSKKSLDMAVRHMDLRKSIQGNMKPLMTKIPASSMYSVRSDPTKSRAISVSDSPLATSSNASSEVSVNHNGFFMDRNELGDDINSEMGATSPASIRGR